MKIRPIGLLRSLARFDSATTADLVGTNGAGGASHRSVWRMLGVLEGRGMAARNGVEYAITDAGRTAIVDDDAMILDARAILAGRRRTT